MTDPVYTKAVERMRALRLELERLEGFVRTYDEIAAALDSADARDDFELTEPAVGRVEAEMPSRRRRGVSQDELDRVVCRVLLEHGAPLQRQELFEKVKALGTVIGGANELGNFGSKISRSSKLQNHPGRGYWLKDRPLAEERPQ